MAEKKITTRAVKTPAGEIVYRLERKAVKNLNLRVRRDGSVYVSAHRRVPAAEIDGFVAKHWEYVREASRRMAELERRQNPSRQYTDGEIFRILGKELPLRISPGEPERAEETEGCLLLRLRDPGDPEKRRRLVESYLDRRCREVFQAVLEECWPPFRKYGVPMPTLRVRRMRSRWGSCLTGQGVVTLNVWLLEFPMDSIRYVAFHELCHFVHPDHSGAFYDLLAAFVPDWKERRAALNQMAREEGL